MSMYNQFVNVMQNNMLEPLFSDYESSINLYKDQYNNNETNFNYATWLDNHIAHAIIDGY
ncbi:hypothetical protein AN161_17875 [Lysinibacillus sp. FJAT-14222]|nr:hypothetical protein AN161_17875 [Lysinibacillus sp. FJAT-14222]